MRFLFITCLSILSLFTNLVNAQVTIGSDSKPLEGALLDLKEHDPDTDNVTSTKGLLLPRVELTEIGSLKDIEGADLSNPLQYKGLLVYNVPDNRPCGKPSGLFVWNGSQWINLAGEDVYDIPGSLQSDLYILKRIMTDNPGHSLDWVIDDSDPNDLKWISGSGVSFRSVCGKERLQTLTINNKNITTLNITGATELLALSCDNNNISSIDLSTNTKLQTLSINNNSLKTLDVSNNPELFTLYCSINSMKTLSVANNVRLNTLECSKNGMTSLNLIGANKLERVVCDSNSLTTLDLSGNLDLKYIHCMNNFLTTLNPKSPKLEELNCMFNSISNIDISANIELKKILIASNQLSTLNTTNNTKLESITCSNNNNMSSLNLTTNTKLIYLDIQNCTPLGILNLSNNTELNSLLCAGAFIFSLDLTNNNKLTHLDVGTTSQFQPSSLKICQSTYNNIATLVPAKGNAIYNPVSCP